MTFKFRDLFLLVPLILILVSSPSYSSESSIAPKKLVYIMPDSKIPFWHIMGRGIQSTAESLDYNIKIYDTQNSAKLEIQFIAKAIKDKVSGIIVSPSNSSACVTLLKLAKNAGIPVVISDIGTESGEYVSYISSNNKDGAYFIGQLLSKKLLELGWENGRVGIIAIPQKRLNGQARTAGFMQAIEEHGIKSASIKQLVTWSTEETYNFTREMLKNHPDLRAIWLQTSNIYKGALDAIVDSGKQDEVLLITFDAEPEFLELIPQGLIIGSAMQQPYLMGMESVKAMDNHLNGKPVEKNLQLPILIISSENIADKLPVINKMVLGVEN